ncbi:MAG: pyridoxamine 5'-phosphate oxidase family protein [Thermomicrobiales bacterium]|nr:pyridoxamine 5'-phosphate oxidase family protein [Thermomicrobiales bacterium]
MRHTPADLDALQALLDRSHASAGRHLRATFELPEHALSARQLARYLEQDHVFVVLATTTSHSEPRVAPVDSVFAGGHFHIPTVADAARVRHVRHRPGVSLTHFVPNEVAIIVHGAATVIEADEPDFAPLDACYTADWWRSVRAEGNGAFLRIVPHACYTWARDPAAFPS